MSTQQFNTMNSIIKKLLKPSFILAGAVCLLVSCNKELPEAEPIKTPAPTGSSIYTLLNDPNFSTLKAAVAKAAPASSSGLLPLSVLLSDSTAVYTFFAPDNSALQLSGITPAVITGMSAGKLDTILRYHLVGGQKVTSALIKDTFPNIQLPTSLVLAPPSTTLPPGLRMSIFPSKRGTILWANNISITQADIPASNGVIHKVALLVAPPSQVLWARIASDPELTYLKAAINRADEGVATESKLESALSNAAANLTVFAPTDAAFKAILTAQITQQLMLQGMDQATAFTNATAIVNAKGTSIFTDPMFASVFTPTYVKGLVVYHMLGKRAFSVNIPATPTNVKTLLSTASPLYPGVTIQATFNTTGMAVTAASVKGAGNTTASNVLMNSSTNMTNSDQHYINGVLHKIDQVLRPQ